MQAGTGADGTSDIWKWVLGLLAVGGAAFGVVKSVEAKQHAVAAQVAERQASNHRAEAEAASRRAADMERRATRECGRADIAENRARKLAIAVAEAANRQIALLRREDVPTLRFGGCAAAAANGLGIWVDVDWLLSGVVDSAVDEGAISGRVIGVVAHEWYHFLDTQRGTRHSHEEELCADGFAGRQLARLGIPPHHFADLLRQYPQSSTHPAGQRRAEAVLDAWESERRKSAS